MSRYVFLTLASFIALAVGAMALAFPTALLDSKGVIPHAGTVVWLREMGAVLIATGVTAFLLRRCEGGPALRAWLVGQALLQLALLPIEPLAYIQGTVTKLSGIVPNTLLHVLLAFGFFHFAFKIKSEEAGPQLPQDTVIDPDRIQASPHPAAPLSIFVVRENQYR